MTQSDIQGEENRYYQIDRRLEGDTCQDYAPAQSGFPIEGCTDMGSLGSTTRIAPNRKVSRRYADTHSKNKNWAPRKNLQGNKGLDMVNVKCTRCKQPIDVSDSQTYLAREGQLVRIRCLEENCRGTDWYSEAEFEGGTLPLAMPTPDSGQSKTKWYDILTSGL
jgi:hypothetical protein